MHTNNITEQFAQHVNNETIACRLARSHEKVTADYAVYANPVKSRMHDMMMLDKFAMAFLENDVTGDTGELYARKDGEWILLEEYTRTPGTGQLDDEIDDIDERATLHLMDIEEDLQNYYDCALLIIH